MGQRTQVILIKENKEGEKKTNVFHLQWGFGRNMYMMFMDLINVDYNKDTFHDGYDFLNILPTKNRSWSDETEYLVEEHIELLNKVDINNFQSVYDIMNVCDNNNGALVISMKEDEKPYYTSHFKIGFMLGWEERNEEQTDYVSPKEYAELNRGSNNSDEKFFEAMDLFYKYFEVEYVLPKTGADNNWKNKVIEVAETLDWNVSINENDFCFETWSPCGQDLCVELTAKDFNLLLEELENYYDGYDPDEEAKLWYGANKGEPSSMRDLLNDMEWCKKAIKELHEQLNK